MLFLLMYALFIAGGLALYKIIIETIVKSKQKDACQDYNLAFGASSPATGDHRIIFNFDNGEYAQIFAELNRTEVAHNTG